MSGNATQRYANTAVLSVCGVDALHVVTSAEIDERLAATYRRVGLRPGLLQNLAGITERRWWPRDACPLDVRGDGRGQGARRGRGRPRAGGAARRQLGEPRPPGAVGRRGRAPRAGPAADVHELRRRQRLPRVPQRHAARRDDDRRGRIDYALVVDGEGAREIHENTLERLAQPDATRDDVLSQFATLTLGSGAAAMVLGRADEHPEGHRLVGSVLRAATEHHELCIGDLNRMSTDTKGLLDAGMAISAAMWTDAQAAFDWSAMDRYIAHQVSQVFTAAMCRRCGSTPTACRRSAARQHGPGVHPVHAGDAGRPRCRPATGCC